MAPLVATMTNLVLKSAIIRTVISSVTSIAGLYLF